MACSSGSEPSAGVGCLCWLGMISGAGSGAELCSPTPCGRHLKQGHVNQIAARRKQALAGLSGGSLGP